ncbi:MAG TPA: hypothetical protein VJU86_06765 [Pyrinomonadaceae bacterium]|nr:hypothetical protein [Pyrinomonadaceae bacterium]
MKETNEAQSGIRRGSSIIVVLHNPREKSWGILDEISSAGIFLRGLDLNSFDDWLHAVVHDEPFIGFGDLFFPMWRVERISLDESTPEIPSLRDQVERRTGRSVGDLLVGDIKDLPDELPEPRQ